MQQYYWLGFVALLAVVVKSWVLYQARCYNKLTSAFTILSLCLILQNAAEFLVALAVAIDVDSTFIYMHLVILALNCVLLSLVYFSTVVSQLSLGVVSCWFFLAWGVLLVILQSAGLLILGIETTSYSVISVPGPYYFLFLSYVCCGLVVVGIQLVYGIKSSNKSISERSLVAMKAVMVLIFVGVFVLVSRLLGYNSSTGVALPLASTLFLWILMLDQRNEFVVLEQKLDERFAKFLIKWKTLVLLALKMRDIDPTEWREFVDQSLIDGALKKKSTVQDAAKLLGMPRTTLNTKIKKRRS